MPLAPGDSQTQFEALKEEWQASQPPDDGENDFSRLTDEWRAVAWRSGGKTLLDALGLQYSEVALCRGLAWLLDPNGGHQLGHHPLHAFLTKLDVPVAAGAQVEIRVEETHSDSRADIVVRVGESTVIIETKVLAGEQPRQADRIFEYWAGETPTLVFLTRTGHLPSTALRSAGSWIAMTWRDVATLIRDAADRSGMTPSASIRRPEFVSEGFGVSGVTRG